MIVDLTDEVADNEEALNFKKLCCSLSKSPKESCQALLAFVFCNERVM